MLREISHVKQDGPNRRRWFHDDWFDIFTWQLADGTICNFDNVPDPNPVKYSVTK